MSPLRSSSRVADGFLIALLLPLLLSTSGQLSEADLRSAVITMMREGSGLFGLSDKTDIRQDASYTVSIAGDGTVTYSGRNGVRTIGTRTHKVPVESIRALLVEFDQAAFWTLNDRYDSIDVGNGLIKTVSDLTKTTVAVSVGARRKSVYDYYGTPPIVRRLEARIDEVADSRRYTGRPPG